MQRPNPNSIIKLQWKQMYMKICNVRLHLQFNNVHNTLHKELFIRNITGI